MNLYITNITANINEGGMARNNAFWNHFKKLKNYSCINVYERNLIFRIFRIIKTSILLLTTRNKVVFIHQNTILYLYPVRLLNHYLFGKVLQRILHRIARLNRLIIEINDLPYEQSKDLGLVNKKEYKKLQRIIFSTEQAELIFASKGLRDYALCYYRFKSKKTAIVVNGAPMLNKSERIKPEFQWQSSDKINCIYTGTLNKGRDIEQLIRTFQNNQQANLILIGNSGEWINSLALSDNIYFEGSFNESDAQKITSLCDLGLIPYNTNKLYYNLCFPTKVSFYLESGIKVVSTPLKELCDRFIDSDFIIFSEFNNWKNEINKLKKADCRLHDYNHEFSWNKLLENIQNLEY